VRETWIEIEVESTEVVRS